MTGNALAAIWILGMPVFSGLLYTVMANLFGEERGEDSIGLLAGTVGLFWPIFSCVFLVASFPLSGILIAKAIRARRK